MVLAVLAETATVFFADRVVLAPHITFLLQHLPTLLIWLLELVPVLLFLLPAEPTQRLHPPLVILLARLYALLDVMRLNFALGGHLFSQLLDAFLFQL